MHSKQSPNALHHDDIKIIIYLLRPRVPPRKLHPLELRARLQQIFRSQSTCWCREGTWWCECYRSTCPSWRQFQTHDETCYSLQRPWLRVCSTYSLRDCSADLCKGIILKQRGWVYILWHIILPEKSVLIFKACILWSRDGGWVDLYLGG